MAFQVQERPEVGPEGVSTVTIRDLLGIAGGTTIDILKVDIECAEQELFGFDGAPWLDDVGTVVIELHDWIREGNGTAFYRAISRYDFRQFIKGENIIIVRSRREPAVQFGAAPTA
jgi:hypothetical protein